MWIYKSVSRVWLVRISSLEPDYHRRTAPTPPRAPALAKLSEVTVQSGKFYPTAEQG